MDLAQPYHEEDEFEDAEEQLTSKVRPAELPPDLPKSLDDRRSPQQYVGETEMYDAWQGTTMGIRM